MDGLHSELGGSRDDLQGCASEQSDPSPQPCPHFLRGSCRYGDRCRYLHTTEDSNGAAEVEKRWADVDNGPDLATAADSSDDPWNVKDPWSDLQVDSNGWEEAPPEQRQPQEATQAFPNNYKPKPCIYFAKGNCIRGDSCHFQHLSTTETNYSKSPYSKLSAYRAHYTPNSYDHSAINAGYVPPPVGPSREPCQFFLRRHCPRNDDCPFIHENPECPIQSTDDGSSTSLCQLFIKGKCARGTSCPFLHNEPVAEVDVQDTLVTTDPDICQLHISGRCTRGSACPFRHEPADEEVPFAPDNTSTDICQFFGRGGCPRGDRCPFLHTLTETSDPINSSLPNARASPRFGDIFSQPFDGPPQSSTVYTERCKFFDQGHCFRGSSCRYPHISPNGNVESQPPGLTLHQSKKLCHFFQKGNCTKGDKCNYSHAITDGENAQEQTATGRGWAEQNSQWPSSEPGSSVPWQYTKERDSRDGMIDEQPLGANHGGVAKAAYDENSPQNFYQKPICKLYSQGYCKFGDSCRFLHSSPGDRGPVAPKNMRICDFFARGNCRKGTACSFVHETKDHQPGTTSDWDLPTEPWVTTENSGQGEDQPWNSWGYDEDPGPDWSSNHEGSEKGKVSHDEVAIGHAETDPGTPDNMSWSQHECIETETVVNGLDKDENQPEPPPVRLPTVAGPLHDPTEENIEEDETQPHPIEPVSGSHADQEFPGEKHQYMDSSSMDLIVEESGDSINSAHPQTLLEYAAHGRNSNVLLNDNSVDAETQTQTEKSMVAETEIQVTLPNAQIARDTTVERHVLNSRITLSAGATVQKVLTAFESPFLNVSNLPEDVRDVEVQELVEPFGKVIKMVLGRSTLHTAALIEYTNCAGAVLAARTLNKSEYRSMVLTATLDLLGGSQNEDATDLSSHTIKLSWPTPSLTGWAYYSSISIAKEQAKLLQGLTVGNRKITVTYIPPRKKQTHSFTVELKNLPQNVTKDDLKALCPGTTSVSISPQTNYDQEDAVRHIRDLLTPYEPVKSFYVLPPDASKVRTIAFASFHNTETASKVSKELHRSKHECLKNNALSVQQVFTVMHDLALSHFNILKDEFDRIRDDYEKDCKIRLLDKDENGQPVDPIHIHIDSTDPLAVGRARKALEGLLSGDTLLLEEATPWDDYFDTHEGRAFFANLNSDTRFFVKHSRRKQTLEYFSRQIPIGDARELILRQLRQIRARSHKISVQTDAIQPLLSGRLKRLREDDGIPAILNIVSRTLTVESDDPNDVKKAKRVLAELTSSSPKLAASPASESQCTVCGCIVTEPINLSCGHVYCQTCLRYILHYSIGTNPPPLMCMVDREDNHFETSLPCYTEFPIKVIESLLSEREERKLFQFALLSYVRQHPEEFHFCPTPGCPVFYRPDKPDYVLQCPSCQTRICPSCCVTFHEGLSCTQYREA